MRPSPHWWGPGPPPPPMPSPPAWPRSAWDPSAEGRIRSVNEGDRIPLGDRYLDVMYTPGHASHHVRLVDSDSGALFTGDALGIHFPDVRVLRPATPPPDLDVELAVDSIERIRARAETALMFSHFGPVR